MRRGIFRTIGLLACAVVIGACGGGDDAASGSEGEERAPDGTAEAPFELQANDADSWLDLSKTKDGARWVYVSLSNPENVAVSTWAQSEKLDCEVADWNDASDDPCSTSLDYFGCASAAWVESSTSGEPSCADEVTLTDDGDHSSMSGYLVDRETRSMSYAVEVEAGDAVSLVIDLESTDDPKSRVRFMNDEAA